MSKIDFGYYTIKDQTWLDNQRHAGKILSNVISLMTKEAHPGMTTKQLNDIGEDFIKSHYGCTPTFKGYKGFPEAFCLSLNKEIVHGIPKDDVILKEGDILKIDGGVTYNGAIADMATTIHFGEIDSKYKILMDYCQRALMNAITFLNDHRNARLGDIGYVVKKTVSKIGASVLEDLSGHGIEYGSLHFFPTVLNCGEQNKGIRLHPGMTLAIEPLITYGNSKVKTLEDGWTTVTEGIAVHYEHTIFIHEDKVEIITL